jgi:hypothetical protein
VPSKNIKHLEQRPRSNVRKSDTLRGTVTCRVSDLSLKQIGTVAPHTADPLQVRIQQDAAAEIAKSLAGMLPCFDTPSNFFNPTLSVIERTRGCDAFTARQTRVVRSRLRLVPD